MARCLTCLFLILTYVIVVSCGREPVDGGGGGFVSPTDLTGAGSGGTTATTTGSSGTESASAMEALQQELEALKKTIAEGGGEASAEQEEAIQGTIEAAQSYVAAYKFFDSIRDAATAERFEKLLDAANKKAAQAAEALKKANLPALQGRIVALSRRIPIYRLRREKAGNTPAIYLYVKKQSEVLRKNPALRSDGIAFSAYAVAYGAANVPLSLCRQPSGSQFVLPGTGCGSFTRVGALGAFVCSAAGAFKAKSPDPVLCPLQLRQYNKTDGRLYNASMAVGAADAFVGADAKLAANRAWAP